MKVLITTDLYTTNTNGVVTSVHNLMEEQEKKGHEVRVLTVSEKLRSHNDHVEDGRNETACAVFNCAGCFFVN